MSVVVLYKPHKWGGALRDDTKNGCVADYLAGDWKRILSFYCYLFIYLFTLLQNWLAFSYLDEPPFSEHDSIYYLNDKRPLQSHHNAFCKASIPVLSSVLWVSIHVTVQLILLNKFKLDSKHKRPL